MSKREINESGDPQGIDEDIPYVLDTSPWGGTPTSPDAKIFLIEEGGALTDQTSTLMSGSPIVTVNDITLPFISGLAEGKQYRVEVKFTIASNAVLEAFTIIKAER